MRKIYWTFGFALVAIGLLLPWFDPVTTPRFNALNFPFAHSAYLWPGHFAFFSYGAAAIIAAGLGVIAWRNNKGLAVLCAGMLLLLGAMTFLLQIMSWEPTWLKMALEGGEDFQHCYHLEVAYSIPDAVVRSPARGLFEPVEALAERFHPERHRATHILHSIRERSACFLHFGGRQKALRSYRAPKLQCSQQHNKDGERR